MKFFGRLVFSVFSNALAIMAASYVVADFIFDGDFIDLLIAAGILMVINTFARPVMKLVFGPIIVLTLGLFILVINGLVIVLLDFFSPSITINGLMPLFLATFIIGAVNFLINSSARFLFKKN
ncbi:MAG: phage holin family protein [Patescibacteria group bacterium]